MIHFRQRCLPKRLRNKAQWERQPFGHEIRQDKKYDEYNSKNIEDVREYDSLYPLQQINRLEEGNPKDTDEVAGLWRFDRRIGNKISQTTNFLRLDQQVFAGEDLKKSL